jgi:hypothetical protein
MFICYHQNGGQIRIRKVASRFFENIETFRCLGTILTNQNYTHE